MFCFQDTPRPTRTHAWRRSRTALLVACAALAALGAAAQETSPPHTLSGRERTAHPEAEAAAREIRCDCGCPPQSAWECACGHAAGMVSDMDREALAGASVEAIVAGYLEREGPAILLEPPARGWNLTAWLGPSALILAGAVMIIILLGVWRRRDAPPDAPGAPNAAGTGSDGAYRLRAIEELERFEREGLG